MDAEHERIVATRLGVGGRAPEHLGPVAGQSLDVLGMPGMRERMVEERILQAPLVVCRGERKEGRLAAGEGEHR